MNIQLYNQDCLEVLKTIPDKSIQLILQDPPYNTTSCEWEWDIMTKIDEFWNEWKRIITDTGAVVMTATQPFTSKLICSNLQMFKYEWIWDKVTARGHLVAKKRPMAQHENIIVFGSGKTKYNPQMIDRPKDKIKYCKVTEYSRTDIMGGAKTKAPQNKVYDKWYPKTIIVESNAGSSVKSIHPTQKPVPLMEYLIKTYTDEGDIVFDGFMGSGSTGVACKNLNRGFIGCELSEEYFNGAKQRIEEPLGLDIFELCN